MCGRRPRLRATTVHGRASGSTAMCTIPTRATALAPMSMAATTVRSQPGIYHLAIAGIGVSDPIYIGSDAWDRAGKAMAAGEYHHRWGIALDGRYGYARPVAHKDGVTGPIYESDLPYYFSGLGGGFASVSGVVQDNLGARPPWKRTTRVPYGGSWADAGDWVTRIAGVAAAIYQFCEMALLCGKPTNHNVPKVSEILDPEFYAGTDQLPESVHQAIFGADTYRVCQYKDGGTFPAGAVPSGLGMGSGTGTVSAPAHLSHDTNFCYAPDHPSTRAYCMAAAKISSTLKHFGCDRQATVWLDSAVAAWNWCEHIRNGDAAVDAYYNDVLHAEAKTGWSRQQFLTNIANMNQYADDPYRTHAAACLWRATGDAQYQSIIETALGIGSTPWGRCRWRRGSITRRPAPMMPRSRWSRTSSYRRPRAC